MNFMSRRSVWGDKGTGLHYYPHPPPLKNNKVDKLALFNLTTPNIIFIFEFCQGILLSIRHTIIRILIKQKFSSLGQTVLGYFYVRFGTSRVQTQKGSYIPVMSNVLLYFCSVR